MRAASSTPVLLYTTPATPRETSHAARTTGENTRLGEKTRILDWRQLKDDPPYRVCPMASKAVSRRRVSYGVRHAQLRSQNARNLLTAAAAGRLDVAAPSRWPSRLSCTGIGFVKP